MIVEYFEPLSLQLHIATPDHIPEADVSGKIRRNILLCVKETLHNIIKHSKATKVLVQFETYPGFSITIKDNGIGFDPDLTYSHKNGLHNIRERIRVIGGSFHVSNTEGTTITLKLPSVNYPI